VILGLNQVYHPHATFKCPYCLVTNKEIADFNIVSWAFRDLQKMKENATQNSNENVKTRSNKAKNYQGQTLTKAVPCALHLLMAMVRVLLNRFFDDADDNTELAVALTTFLEQECKIKLPPDTDSNGKEVPFVERVTNARLNRVNYVAVLKNKVCSS